MSRSCDPGDTHLKFLTEGEEKDEPEPIELSGTPMVDVIPLSGIRNVGFITLP